MCSWYGGTWFSTLVQNTMFSNYVNIFVNLFQEEFFVFYFFFRWLKLMFIGIYMCLTLSLFIFFYTFLLQSPSIQWWHTSNCSWCDNKKKKLKSVFITNRLCIAFHWFIDHNWLKWNANELNIFFFLLFYV